MASELFKLSPDPMLKSAIAVLGQSLSVEAPTPQQTRAAQFVDRMAAAAATLHGDPAYLPDSIEEEW